MNGMIELPENVLKLQEMLKSCRMCPRSCAVDRTAGQLGACRTTATVKISSSMPHFGEEPALVGTGGSGTIFFCGCNLDCVFCQNFELSQMDTGKESSPGEIVELALQLQEMGCENINFVTPTHVAFAVAEVIIKAREKGLQKPTVYNCGGYESVETLMFLEGLIDIYMPDFKYADAEKGFKYSSVKEYPKAATAALKEMYRQVGPLVRNARGVAQKGVMVRHLVMPNDLADSRKVIEIVAETAPGCSINVMGQYRPAYRAREYPELQEYPSSGKIRELREYADQLGLRREGME
jgi:putative pyruvate formate lyase activating enzyme